jgi:hypothetical protein
MVTAIDLHDTEFHRQVAAWSKGVSGGSTGPGQKNAVSDPTGNSALATDEFGILAERANNLLTVAHRAIKDLYRLTTEYSAPPLPKEPEARGVKLCANMHGCEEHATHAGRCHACHTHWMRHTTDRSKSNR